MNPLIGITPEAATVGPAGRHGAFCDLAYSRSVERAGGVPVVLPLTRDRRTLEEFLARCDGFILSGGGDLGEETGAYGRLLTASERNALGKVDAVRDEMELYLAQEAVRREVPLLAICRGIQVLNVALGGTLSAEVAGHRGTTHKLVWTDPLLNLTEVNSSHHQALDRVASPLKVVARAEDGIVEAVVLVGARFCVGVQFHPERMESGEELFRKLVLASQAPGPAR